MSPRIIGRSITQPPPSISPPSLIPPPSTPPPPSFCEVVRASQIGCRTCEIDDLRTTLAGYLQTLKDHQNDLQDGAAAARVPGGKGDGNWTMPPLSPPWIAPPPSPPPRNLPSPPLSSPLVVSVAEHSHDSLSTASLSDSDTAALSVGESSSPAATRARVGLAETLLIAAGGLLLVTAIVILSIRNIRLTLKKRKNGPTDTQVGTPTAKMMDVEITVVDVGSETSLMNKLSVSRSLALSSTTLTPQTSGESEEGSHEEGDGEAKATPPPTSGSSDESPKI